MNFFALKKYAIKIRLDQEIKKIKYGNFDVRRELVLDKLQYEFFISRKRIYGILFYEEIEKPNQEDLDKLINTGLFSNTVKALETNTGTSEQLNHLKIQ